jgi:hypothetical protein
VGLKFFGNSQTKISRQKAEIGFAKFAEYLVSAISLGVIRKFMVIVIWVSGCWWVLPTLPVLRNNPEIT